MQWYLDVLRNYATFSGRAGRAEYWNFVLINLLISLGLSLVDQLVLGSEGTRLLSSLYSLLVLIPSLAVGVRRLHDTNRGGLWILINLIPVIGWLVFLFFMVQPSDPGSNEYGAAPRQLAAGV